jgi:hypothetical protein
MVLLKRNQWMWRGCTVLLLSTVLSGCTRLGSPEPFETPRSDSASVDDILSKYCPSLDYSERDELTMFVEYAARDYGLEPALVLAVITAESNCRTNARSRAGALGLMQLMPKTAHWLGVENPFSELENVRGGSRYLAYLIEMFDSDVTLALAAYNAGPTRVREHGGIPPFRETRNYLRKVYFYYQEYRLTE